MWRRDSIRELNSGPLVEDLYFCLIRTLLDNALSLGSTPCVLEVDFLHVSTWLFSLTPHQPNDHCFETLRGQKGNLKLLSIGEAGSVDGALGLSGGSGFRPSTALSRVRFISAGSCLAEPEELL